MLLKPPYIRPGVIPLPKAKPPVASYDPKRKVAAVVNGYHVREVLKASGYHWDEASKTWRRDCTIEEFRADYDLFHNVGVDLDAATATLLAAPVKTPEPVAKTAQADNDDLFGPKVDDFPIKSTPKPAAVAKAAPAATKPSFDASSLTRARERILRLAASGRIKDQKDLEELRSIAGLIRQAIEVA